MDPTRRIWARVVAYFLDGIIDVVILLVLISVLDLDVEQTVGVVVPQDVGDNAPQWIALALFYLAWWVVSRVWLVGAYGWTPGKLALGLRVVRWEGRPPGPGWAALRGLVFTIGSSCLGSLYALVAFGFVLGTKAHRAPHDYAAGTYVIDAFYLGRLLVPAASGGVVAGPPSVTREEAMAYAEEHHLPLAYVPPRKAKRDGNPVYDKTLGAYVVWNAREEQWLALDPASQTWRPLS
ncbi:MAG: RDD family protein [Acidimicrobiales bacterium]|jgi:uncharacterized RDD family membrane protein YckC|nr:RDD family protein [Acidimicrobiales bacterium]